jgi:predicted transcriptional regulator
MYTNIPREEIKHIVNNVIKNNYGINEKIQNEIAQILEVVLEQNYFQSDHEYYKQTNGGSISNTSKGI